MGISGGYSTTALTQTEVSIQVKWRKSKNFNGYESSNRKVTLFTKTYPLYTIKKRTDGLWQCFYYHSDYMNYFPLVVNSRKEVVLNTGIYRTLQDAKDSVVLSQY